MLINPITIHESSHVVAYMLEGVKIALVQARKGRGAKNAALRERLEIAESILTTALERRGAW
jgi:hypothetical protein